MSAIATKAATNQWPADLLAFALEQKVDLYLDQQSIDTTTPMGKLVFQVTGAFAEFERSIIRQRVRAGLRRAVAQGKVLGRPKLAAELEQRIRAALNAPDRPGTRVIARQFGVSRPTVLRIAGDGPEARGS